MIEIESPIGEWILSIADDKHLMGQQHAEWIGVTPFLEEDLAFCSIGQDELGHAALLYELLAGDDDEAIDALAYNRDASAYRSSHLVELATGDWAVAFVRHLVFDVSDAHRWASIAACSKPELADVAQRVEREEAFHRAHARQMLEAMLVDPGARERLVTAMGTLAPLVPGLFEATAGETEAVSQGVIAQPFASSWPLVRSELEGWFGPIDWGPEDLQNGRTLRSGDWQPLMTRMREVIDLDRDARW